MSARRHHRWPTCSTTGKKRFGERKDAKEALRLAAWQRQTADLRGGYCTNTCVRAYKCSDCHGWHLTSAPRYTPTAQALTA